MFFSLNTPPGTKVKLLGTVQVKNGLLLLDDSKISVLGGEVDHMVEKWELQRVRFCYDDSYVANHLKSALKATARVLRITPLLQFNLQSLAKHSRSNIGAEGGPPPFVPFGQVRIILIMIAHFSKYSASLT